MKKLKILFLAISIVFVYSCEDKVEAPGTNYITLEDSEFNIEVAPDGGITDFDITVYSANISGSERTYQISVDESSTVDPAGFIAPDSFTIPAGTNEGVISITANDVDLDFVTPKTLVLNIDEVNEYGSAVGTSTATINILQECIFNKVNVSITLDNWPDETSWEIYNLDVSTSEPILTGGPYANPADDFGVKRYTFCLEAGNYGIAVYDAYGDGISDGGYEVSLEDGTVLASGPVVGTIVTDLFTLN